MKFVLASIAVAAAAVAAPAQAQNTIRIGIALSETGNLADSAKHYWRGVELWRDQTNAAGGLLGKKVEFVVYDDRSDAATSARLYERLITSDKVDLLVSTIGSAQAATATAVAEKHKRIMINGGGASESIQQRGFKYIFQTAARISAYVDGIEPLMKKYNVKSMAFVSRDYAAARDMEKVVKGQAQRNGVNMVMDEYFPSGNVDFSSQIARARQSKPELWVSVGYPNEAIEMMRQFRASNYTPKIFVHNGVAQEDFVKATGKDGEGAIGMSLYEPSLKTSGNAEFVKNFKARYNYEPGYYSSFGYNAVYVLGEAVMKAGSIDQEKLRETLTTMKLDTVMGKHEVEPKTGMQIGIRGLLVQVQNGKREIIWPEELKSAEAKVPMPGSDAK
ncbi:ABC transporter substrate-binding protein [Ramlibacter sp. RBP-2]|uniref:ABC transporter substrate-binding protein n=1 Tax=Ramlibacter lithotrophicus TaxID=2606681 RepID=A0A7X6DDX0_9BURK|nr:amino acid ABC transporter substrate-binding protein [Ramlibacter lithotrophicus]NKE65389.1 ABC transporter substrate-binding protein [Ramlibacter lithotrophicus]